jgi:hypothetical protein
MIARRETQQVRDGGAPGVGLLRVRQAAHSRVILASVRKLLQEQEHSVYADRALDRMVRANVRLTEAAQILNGVARRKHQPRRKDGRFA